MNHASLLNYASLVLYKSGRQRLIHLLKLMHCSQFVSDKFKKTLWERNVTVGMRGFNWQSDAGAFWEGIWWIPIK